jgi:hypothetical protein
MSKKRRPQPREIEASRLVLRDVSGKVRIMLDAGGDDGHASICIFSPDGRGNMQIGTQPNGAVVMSFGDKRMRGMLTLSTRGMVLRAQDGRLGVVVGPIADGQDNVTVYRDGRPVWASPVDSPKRSRKPAPKRHKKRRRPAGT